jgi:dCMP deaminase
MEDVGDVTVQQEVEKPVSSGIPFYQTQAAQSDRIVDECLCLHAEENALLEAGRERIGEDSVIYCNTYVFVSDIDWTRVRGTDDRCPCLRCSVKIVQCGVREVVYNQSYSMDEASAMVLKEGGVILRQLTMP